MTHDLATALGLQKFGPTKESLCRCSQLSGYDNSTGNTPTYTRNDALLPGSPSATTAAVDVRIHFSGSGEYFHIAVFFTLTSGQWIASDTWCQPATGSADSTHTLNTMTASGGGYPKTCKLLAS